MTTHVFIVDFNTFRLHLEYMFAGTGAKEHFIDFNDSETTSLHYTTENNLLAMISDASRIRKDDFIIFYLQQNIQHNINEGKFYGIFKAKQNFSFLDNYDKNQYLKKDLSKSLTFRILIEPYEVYSEGVTEWEALDEIKYINSPNQMLWSLIYRKLKGNRGNTMITIYESERLFKLIKDKNKRKILNGKSFTFNLATQRIEKFNKDYNYNGRQKIINILPRLISKYNKNLQFENHLQAYIVYNIGKNLNKSMDDAILGNYKIEWIGNEVYCGVGMQKIDIMLSVINKDKRVITPIELKSGEAHPEILNQMKRYINWVEQYYIPNRISDIQPIIISKKFDNKNSDEYVTFINNIKKFNNVNFKCLPLKYIEFEFFGNNLNFQNIEY